MHIEIQSLLPHRDQETQVAFLACVFLHDLQFDGFVGFLESGEKGGNRLAHLEIDGAIFNLDDHVVVELAVERMKNIVGGAGAIVFQVGPIKVMVVNKRTVEEHAAVRFERAGNHIGSIGGSTARGGGAGAAFGIGFYDKTAEVRNQAVNLVGFRAPKFGDLRIERIE